MPDTTRRKHIELNRRMENYLIRASALENIRPAIKELGGDPQAILEQAGLAEVERDPQAWFSYYKFLLLLEDGARATDCPYFGLHLSKHQGIDILGPVGFVIQQATDLRTALRELTIHLVHHNQGAAVNLTVDNGLAMWRFDCRLEGHAPTWHQMDLVAGIGVNVMRLLCSPNWSPDAIHFPHAPPQNMRPYRQRFDCPLFFNSDGLILSFDAAILDSPIDEANPQLHWILEQHLRNLQLTYPDDYCGQIRHLINQALTTGDCSIERVAGHLAIDKRTLQRRLKAHNTNYQQQLEEVRFDIAKRYLRESNGSLTALSAMLCYSNLGTFSTAFRQRHGVTPSDWKKSQQ